MTDTCVSRVPVFAGLSTADQASVAALARPVRLTAGEIAYSATDASSRLIVLHTGRLKIFRLSSDGAEQIVRVLGPGDFAGETSVFTGHAPEDYAAAIDECHLCVFSHEDLEALVHQHPGIGLSMLKTVSTRLADTELRLSSLSSRNVESRLASYLLSLPRTAHGDGATVNLPVAKKDVASLIDTSPESLSRALAQLSVLGLIAMGGGREIAILQARLLESVADGASGAESPPR